MNKHYKIKIDKTIIDHAIQEHSGKCMVADAVRKQIPGASSIDVTADTIRFNVPNEDGVLTRQVYQTPGRACKEIARFDDYGPEVIEPFEFKLDGRQCSTMAVVPTGKQTQKKKTAPTTKKPCVRRQTVRRRHGLKVVE